MRVLTILGTRPEAIKLAPVVVRLRKYPGVESHLCVTGQHRHMLDQVLELFGIQPDDDLDLMRPDQSLFQLTASVLTGLESVLKARKPDLVLVQGDTTTAMVGALAAYYLRIPVGHVEAGLRTGNKYNPFPEEINRRLVDALTDWYFVPTERAQRNLLAEGCPQERIFVTGNTVIDALRIIVERQNTPAEQQRLERLLTDRYGIRLSPHCRLLLVTGHRRESFGADFESICHGLKKIAEHNSDVQIVYPVHLNPHVRAPVLRILGKVERVHLVEPVDYALFIWLLRRCYFVVTDSGGVQEEAPSLGKPALVIRQKTERPEGLAAGVSKLVGTDAAAIFREAQELLTNERVYSSMAQLTNPYGDGLASERIVDILNAVLRGPVDTPSRARLQSP